MTLTDLLLILVAILLAVHIWQAERNRKLNTQVFAAFATMIGEWMDCWLKERKNEPED